MTYLTNIINHRWRFNTLFILLMLLLFLKYVLIVSVPSIIFLIVLALMVLLGDKDEIFATFICCIPLYTAINYYYIVTLCVFVYVFKYFRKLKLNFGFVPISLIFLWEFLHCLSSESDFMYALIATIPYFFLIILVSSCEIKTIDYSFIVRVFSISIIWISFILILSLIMQNNFELIFSDALRLGINNENISSLLMNPNTVGVQCALAIACLFQLYLGGQKRKSNILLICLIIILGFFTLSKTFFVCLFIMVIYTLMIATIEVKKKLQIFFGSIVIFVVTISFMYSLFPSILELFYNRILVDDITSGRYSLFILYNDYILSSPSTLFFGIGASNLVKKVLYVYNLAENVPHNGIQEIILVWGIPGLLIFLMMIYALIHYSKQENTFQTSLNYLPFIVLFAKIMVGQVVTSPYTIMAFSLVYLGLCHVLRFQYINKYYV